MYVLTLSQNPNPDKDSIIRYHNEQWYRVARRERNGPWTEDDQKNPISKYSNIIRYLELFRISGETSADFMYGTAHLYIFEKLEGPELNMILFSLGGDSCT